LLPDDIKAFFELNNVFKDGIELSFQKFRQFFFPHVTIAGFDSKPDIKVNYGPDYDAAAWQLEMKKEMRVLENKIRIKLKNEFTSVRKAFLTLDRDRNGFIEPTEIIKMYGNSFDINYELLEAIF
jgi:hypothetical protein